jgi:hypothetical protein
MSDEKLDAILAKTIRIEAALWPDEGQPGVLTEHDERLDNLESWRNYLTGAWAVVTAIFGFHWLGKHGS